MSQETLPQCPQCQDSNVTVSRSPLVLGYMLPAAGTVLVALYLYFFVLEDDEITLQGINADTGEVIATAVYQNPPPESLVFVITALILIGVVILAASLVCYRMTPRDRARCPQCGYKWRLGFGE